MASFFDDADWGGRNEMPPAPTRSQGADTETLRTEVRSLKQQVGRLALLNQALWELLQRRVGLNETEFHALIQEIDLRDGKADGQLTEHALRCPKCQRVCNSRHQRCLYCGQEFEGDLFAASGK